MWCFELKEAGYISKIERAPSFKLTDGWVNEYEEQLKTKTKIKQQTILQDSEYTPDILLTFEKDKWESLVWLPSLKLPGCEKTKMDKLFIGTNDARIFLTSGYDNGNKGLPYTQVLVENKSSWDYQNMTRIFNINQKQMWEKYKIYVNLVKIPDFFAKSYCPKEYLLTPSGKDRKVNFKYVLIEEYLKNLEK